MKNRTLLGAFLAVAVLAVVPRASADILPLTGGSSSTNLALSMGASSQLLATLNGTYAETIVVPPGPPVTVGNGTYTAQVYKDSNTGDLDFLYTFTVSTGIIDGVSTFGYAGFITNVGYLSPSSGRTPDSVSRSSTGSVINWSYDTIGSVLPGQSTATLAIFTNSQHYVKGFASVIDSGVGSVAGFAPTIPDGGTTVMLLGGALLGLAALRRKFAA